MTIKVYSLEINGTANSITTPEAVVRKGKTIAVKVRGVEVDGAPMERWMPTIAALKKLVVDEGRTVKIQCGELCHGIYNPDEIPVTVTGMTEVAQ